MSATKKILILEDDKFCLKIYSNLLTEEGYEVISTPRADEVARLATEKPNLFIVDLMLEGGNGFDVITEIRGLPGFKETPIMVLSNLGQDSDIEEAKKRGASEYLVKSNTRFQQVADVVKKLIK
jgi:DNA-binding response OmpR family regulator